MELIQQRTPLIELYAALKRPSAFSLVDVGCSGGIDPVFKKLGLKLRALGIDASLDEIERLRKGNTFQGVHYIDGLVGLPEGHPFLMEQGESLSSHNPWDRLSACRSILIRERLRPYQSHEEKMRDNQWRSTRLSTNRITLADTMTVQGFTDVDLLKIDIDGPDFLALQSLHRRFNEFGLLAVVMEVNFFGGERPTDHTFHNTDRFMRRNGFELFGLTTRLYSVSSLPSVFQWGAPCQTMSGRPFQGDALYMRDICSMAPPIPERFLTPEKLINAVLLFSLFGLPDCAAELLLAKKELLAAHLDIDEFLDALTKQSVCMQGGIPENVSSYQELMALYESDPPEFYMGAAGGIDAGKVLARRVAVFAYRWRKLGLKLGLVKKFLFEW